jgi:hypothetical protein
MGFSNQERINANSAALQASTLDANASAVWYEKVFNFQFALPDYRVWTQFTSIPEASTVSIARSNAAANPTIIDDLSQNADAVRMTKIPGTNNSTFATYQTYNDFSTDVLGNWIQPQQITQKTGVSAGQPSSGYTATLYNGDPASGGTVVAPSAGTTGTGSSKTVGWIFNYSIGVLLLSADFYTQTGIDSSTFDPYITGFRYIGTTAGSGSGAIGGTINSTEIAFGTALDTIGGASDFTYDSTNKVLEVEKITSQVVIQIRNETGSTIDAGSVVFVSADGSSIPLVDLADSSDSAKMPSIAVVSNALGTGSNGYGVLTGQINGLDGSAGNTVFDSTITVADIGKTLYVSPTNPGRMTITKPTGSSELIQNVGRIIDINGGNVKMSVSNIGRSNDVPNSFSTTGEIDAGQLTVNSAYSFPTSDGTSGQVLTTDGAGVLSFSSINSLALVCDESISAGDVVRLVSDGDAPTFSNPGRIVKSIATSTNDRTYEALGVANGAGVAGDTIEVLMFGSRALNFASSPSTANIGQPVYLSSSTGGQVTLTAPTTSNTAVVKVGKLINASGLCKIDIQTVAIIE